MTQLKQALAPQFAQMLVAAARRLGAFHYIDKDGMCCLVSDIRDMPPGARIATEEDYRRGYVSGLEVVK